MILAGTVILAIAGLVMLQGGFFAIPTCICGICCCMVGAVTWFRTSRRKDRISMVPVLFAGLAIAYSVSAWVAGLSLTTLASVGMWAACASICFVAAAQTSAQRATTLHALCWFGVATAVTGLLVAAGVAPLAGGMVQSRLQFTFQYANAAGAWYGTIALLCSLSPNQRLRAFAALPMATLLQTQSAGALLVFAITSMVIVIGEIRMACWKRVFDVLLQAMLAVALFISVTLAGTAVGIVVLLAVVSVCVQLPNAGKKIAQHVDLRRGSLILFAALLLCALASALVFKDRTTDALASWIERTHQMKDGIRMWASSPLLGVGPNNWQYLYQYVQTAPYYTTVIHSSVVQLLVDAGILGFSCFGAACVVGLRSSGRALRCNGMTDSVADALAEGAMSTSAPSKNVLDASVDIPVRNASHAGNAWTRAELFAAVFLLAHSAIEFDLQFFALAFLLAFLLSRPSDSTAQTGNITKGDKTEAPTDGAEASGNLPVVPKVNPSGLSGLVAAIACIVVLLPACAVGFLCASTSTAIATASAAEDYAMCAKLYEKNPLAKRDVTAQQEYLHSLFAQQSYQKVIDVFPLLPAPSDRSVYYATISYYALNRQTEATTTLIDRLESQPFNTDFYASAQQLATVYGTDPKLTARFNAAMDAVVRNAEQQ